jgi:murein DD-endopeptidase MepM/ murein hydrolase activator NlpD
VRGPLLLNLHGWKAWFAGRHRRMALAVVLTLAVLLCQSAPSQGGALEQKQEELDRVNQRIKQTQQTLDEVKTRQKSVQRQLATLDAEIGRSAARLRSLESQLRTAEGQLVEAEAELKRVQSGVERRQDLLKRRLRAVSENGTISYLEVLFAATGFADFLSRFQILQDIIQRDVALLEQVRMEKRDIAAKKAACEKKATEIAALRQETAVTMASYEGKQAQAQVLMNTLQNDARYLEAILDDELEASRRLTDEIRRLSPVGPIKAANLRMVWPVPGYREITSPFGNRLHPILYRWRMHTGLDVGAPYGASIVAMEAGEVIMAEWYGAYGRTVVIDHGGSGISTLYAHATILLVKVGQKVTRGQVIAKVGSTGYSTGPHLHLEVRQNGSPVNPLNWTAP